MFSTKYGLQQAVLNGQKVQTRRIVRLPEDKTQDYWNPVKGVDDKGQVFFTFDSINGKHRYIYPHFQLGEVVAIAQAYRNIVLTDPIFFEGLRQEPGWNNKMFVVAKYMPKCILITDIQIERLQDITDMDCCKEGVERWFDSYIVPGIMEQGKCNVCFDTPRDAFASLINKTCGRGTWDRNPYVYAYSFNLIPDFIICPLP